MAGSDEAVALSVDRNRIAVAGNPNSGKTTVFNALTGLRHKVGNYPGVTVEKREGVLAGADATLLDLPGAYGLSARSPDEEIARDVLLGRIEGTHRPDAVVLVIDAGNLERNLYLTSQILDFGMPVVIACNMMDLAAERKVHIDCAALSRELGVPVIPTVASRGEGIDDLRRALERCDGHRPPARPWRLSRPFERAVEQAATAMAASGATPAHAARGAALLWLSDYLSGEAAARGSAERYLAKLPPPQADELRVAASTLAAGSSDAASAAIEARYAWIRGVARRVILTEQTDRSHDDRTTALRDRIDRVLTHRVFGLAIFAGLMFVLFFAVFSWAEPLMDLLEAGQTGLSARVGELLPEGPVRSLITDGLIAGVGAVLAFFPQICILFFCLAMLEDSGYMARAAFLMDRLMGRVGLHGKSFIPLLASYACAIPGILATRTIENRRDRFTTIMVAPLMTCSARLPVYLILIGAVFGSHTVLKAGTLFALYALGTITALVMAMVFKKTILAGPRPTFIMELPPYHVPRPWPILRTVWDRSKLFLTNAGTMIVAASIVVWALSTFPRLDESRLPPDVQARLLALNRRPTRAEDVSLGGLSEEASITHDPVPSRETMLVPSRETGLVHARENILAAARLRHSCVGRLGHAMEPIIKPLGYDWRIGTALLSSFLAREVFVSTMGITFAVGGTDAQSPALRARLATATWPDGRRVLTPLVGVGLMVFYVLACQCVSTLAVTRRETGTWRWPAFMFAYMTVLAYVGALLVYQVGIHLGLGTS